MADAIEDRGVVFFRHRGDLLFTPEARRGQALLAPALVFQAGLIAALQAGVTIKFTQYIEGHRSAPLVNRRPLAWHRWRR